MTSRNADPRFVDDYLAWLLARASAVVSAQFHAVLRAQGLSVAQWRVLAALADGRALATTELAGIVLMKQPTLTKLVDRLESDGLVRRERSALDRRQTLVRIAPAGRARVRRLLPRARAHEAQVLRKLPPADVASLKRRLRTLIALA